MISQSPLRARVRVLIALFAAFTLLAAACGDDDDDTSATSDETAAEVEGADESEDTAADDEAAAEDEAATDAEAEDEAATDEEAESDEAAAAPSLEGDLVGLFAIDAGACTDGSVTGSYFRMLQPGGTMEEGPYIENFDSACDDFTYSLLTPGTDGGLITGTHQAAPDPAFDADGNGLAAAIAQPVTFFGVDFAAASDETIDPISIAAAGGTLSGATSAFTAYYGGEPFNQGAPKPAGGDAGMTSDPTGTIDVESGVYSLDWTSQISGGAFNDFTGVWHLEGTFTPAG